VAEPKIAIPPPPVAAPAVKPAEVDKKAEPKIGETPDPKKDDTKKQ
jgi:hypothetical protein